jgi:two-component system response regulator YesN
MTLRLLIVDDEQVEREGLRAILAKGCPGLEIELAKNGAAALEACRRQVPDLVLMDIKMPGMNGLEAVSCIKREHPAVKFIIVTAYDMFEYAKAAIVLGVSDYILKPSRPAEIVQTVRRVLEEIEREKQSNQARQQTETALRRMMPVIEADVVTSLIYDHAHEVRLEDRVSLLGGDIAGRGAFVMLLRFNNTPHAGLFCSMLRQLIRERGAGWTGALSGCFLPVILFREAGRSYRSQASAMVQQMLSLQRDMQAICFIGIGQSYDTLEEIRLSYQEALIATVDTGFPAKHRFYEDFPAIGELKADYPDKRQEQKFIEQIRFGHWADVDASVMDFVARCEKNGLDIVQAGQRVLELVWIVYRVLTEMGIEAERPYFSFQVNDYRQLRAEAASALTRLIRFVEHHNRQIQPTNVAVRLKQFVMEHSSEDLSLERMAAEVGLSPFYVSKIFKEEIGVNYIDFLTECRMEKAKSLLLDPMINLKAIAYEIGYHDPNYFSKVFKKTTGMTPSEYRKAMIHKKV